MNVVWHNSSKVLIDFDPLPDSLKDVVSTKTHHDLPLSEAFAEELVVGHLCAVPKHVAQDQTNRFVEDFVRLVLNVFLSIQTLGKTSLNVIGEGLTRTEHQVVQYFEHLSWVSLFKLALVEAFSEIGLFEHSF